MLHELIQTHMSPNDHPTTAQGSPWVIRGHPKITFSGNPSRLETANSSLMGPHSEANLDKV